MVFTEPYHNPRWRKPLHNTTNTKKTDETGQDNKMNGFNANPLPNELLQMPNATSANAALSDTSLGMWYKLKQCYEENRILSPEQLNLFLDLNLKIHEHTYKLTSPTTARNNALQAAATLAQIGTAVNSPVPPMPRSPADIATARSVAAATAENKIPEHYMTGPVIPGTNIAPGLDSDPFKDLTLETNDYYEYPVEPNVLLQTIYDYQVDQLEISMLKRTYDQELSRRSLQADLAFSTRIGLLGPPSGLYCARYKSKPGPPSQSEDAFNRLCYSQRKAYYLSNPTDKKGNIRSTGDCFPRSTEQVNKYNATSTKRKYTEQFLPGEVSERFFQDNALDPQKLDKKSKKQKAR